METSTIVAIVIFVAAYALIISEKIHRTIIGICGAMLMILLGIINQETAIHHIDFNTLGLLMGMMVIVNITSETGLFNYLAIWAAKKVKAKPISLLVALSLLTAVCSALLDNVTTVLLTVPITFSITKQLNVDVKPFLIAQILASNIGGTATLIGDPPNIMIGSAVKELTFVAFIENLAPIAIICMVIVLFIMSAAYRRSLVTTPALQQELMQMDEKAAITDHSLLKRSLFVLGLTILGFFTHSFTHIESSLIALTGGFLLLLLAGGSEHLVEKAMHAVEWPTIFFFIGLFIAVGGLIEVGIIARLAETAVETTGGDLTATALLILWMSAVISSVLDNIPFVATMIPLIQNMGTMGIENLEPLWWALALGACLGGNGTLVGASANLIVAGMASERGVRISFIRYFKIGFPLMILTIVLSTVYVYLRYLI